MPIIILPVAYALTFETQTLTAEDLERVRELGRLRGKRENAQSDAAENNAARSS
jgi:hypothetical protein